MDTTGAAGRARTEQVWKQRFQKTVELCASLSWQDDRTGFFQGIAQRLHAMTAADNVNIRLLSSTQDSFVTYVTHGDIDKDALDEYNVLSVSTGRMPHLMRTLEPIVFDFSQPQADDIAWERGAQDGFRTAVTIPLVQNGTVAGVCDLLYHKKQEWDAEDLEWLAQLGRLLGAIVTNALLSEAQISMRLADERRRLSTEIHDNLSQVVNLIAFEAGNMQQSLEEGDRDHLESELGRLAKASDQAVRLLRNEIAQLYSETAEAGISIGDIRTYVEGFSQQWGLSCTFSLKGAREDAVISGRVGVQLMRMLNEALTNIVRHADATHVEAMVEEVADSLSLKVADDGCGFDPESVGCDRMGIRTMRERAHTVDGDVLVLSEAGKGTQVNIYLPHLV